MRLTRFAGETLRWEVCDGILELTLDHAPANEIGTTMLEELEKFAAALEALAGEVSVCILSSARKEGFSAGGDLRELYRRASAVPEKECVAGIREFLERIHKTFNAIDAALIVTIAAVHGVCFGGGFELALTCDLIIADKMARFAFPELRLGIIPGFGGIPRLKRDAGNAVVRDLIFTGRSLNAARAHALGIVSQLTGEGEALRVARATAAQIAKFDSATHMAAKKFLKGIPQEEIRREMEIFCELFTRPLVMDALRKFSESTEAMPYLP